MHLGSGCSGLDDGLVGAAAVDYQHLFHGTARIGQQMRHQRGDILCFVIGRDNDTYADWTNF